MDRFTPVHYEWLPSLCRRRMSVVIVGSDWLSQRHWRTVTQTSLRLPRLIGFLKLITLFLFFRCGLDYKFPSCGTAPVDIGVTRILSGGALFSSKKLTTFLTTEWTTPTSKSPLPSNECPKNWLLLCPGVHLVCWGCTTNFPCKLRLKISPSWGCRCTNCTPGYAYARGTLCRQYGQFRRHLKAHLFRALESRTAHRYVRFFCATQILTHSHTHSEALSAAAIE